LDKMSIIDTICSIFSSVLYTNINYTTIIFYVSIIETTPYHKIISKNFLFSGLEKLSGTPGGSKKL